MIKYGGDALMGKLKDFYNKILFLQNLPVKWEDNVTIPIFKIGEKTDHKNYKGVN